MTDRPLPTLIRSLAVFLEARPEVLEAYLFGSQAREAATPAGDVDVAVYLERTAAAAASPFGYVADRSADLGRAIRRRDVDVVILNDASPLLYHRVIANGVRILARDLRATTTREGRALSRYCDYLPQLRLIDAALQARLAAGTFGR